jgi:hypothetical protein
MAGNTYQLVIDAVYKGRDAFSKAAADVKKLNDDATTGPAKAQAAFGSLSRTMVAFGGVVVAAGLAAKQLYGTLREGAVLQTTEQRFDKLAASIGTTADTMLGKLRDATKGMMSDMDLMSSASQIMSLRLADNEGQVVRLATVVGTLGWDMQQVILTFANMSTMRLDALGLSVSEVKDKAKELEAAGMSAQEAFKEAVILAGEARLDVGGVSEAEQAFKQWEASTENIKNSLTQTNLLLAQSIGLIDGLANAATRLNTLTAYFQAIDEAVSTGAISEFEGLKLKMDASGASTADLTAKTLDLGAAIGIAESKAIHHQLTVGSLGNAYTVMGIGIDNVTAAERDFIIMTEGVTIAAGGAISEIRELLGLQGQLDWMGGAFDRDPNINNRQKWRALAAQNRARQADAAGPYSGLRDGANEATSAVGGYTAAVDEAAAAHQRMGDSFSSFVDQLRARDEAMAKGGDMTAFEDMIIGADGLVNINAANKALYEQAKAAGASAGELALLGVATGQLTEEQAKAALKAAILMEKIKQLAASVVSGDMSIGDAVGGLGDFGAQLNSGALEGAQGGIEGLAQAANAFADGTYQADLSVNNAQANTAIARTQELINDLQGTYHVNVVMTTQGVPLPEEERARGGPVSRNIPYIVGEEGPELFVPQGSGSIKSNNELGRMLTNFQGGSTYSVVVNNYIDGKESGRQSLDDVTADKTRAALMSLGLFR